MTENNLLWSAGGALAVWWWLHRGCKCPDESKPAAQPAPAPAPAGPSPMTPALAPVIAAPPVAPEPQYMPPICPDGFLVGEGGACYRTTMRDVPGFAIPIPYTDIAQPVCPTGYVRQSSSGSCARS